MVQPEVTPAPRPLEGAKLDEWVATHGALWPAAAFVVALDICARAELVDRRRAR